MSFYDILLVKSSLGKIDIVGILLNFNRIAVWQVFPEFQRLSHVEQEKNNNIDSTNHNSVLRLKSHVFNLFKKTSFP